MKQFSGQTISLAVDQHLIKHIVDCHGNILLLGLQWFALIGSNPSKEARRLATSLRSTHYLLPSGVLRVVGCVRVAPLSRGWRRDVADGTQVKTNFGVARKQSNATRVFYSLAHNFAQAHPVGAFAVILPLTQGADWLLASNNGYVLCQTDRGFSNPIALNEALEQLRLRYPNIETKWLNANWQQELPDWAQVNVKLSEQLRNVGGANAWLKTLLLILVITSLVFIGCADFFKSKWQAYVGLGTEFSQGSLVAELHPGHAKGLTVQTVDRAASLAGLVETFEVLPINPAGWQLQSIRCHSMATQWVCDASYQRLDSAARNQGLLKVKPNFAEIVFKPLNQAIMKWSQHRPTMDMPAQIQNSDVKLSPATITWIDTLQEISTAFNFVELSMPNQLVLATRSRQIRIRGPLRSWQLLSRLSVPVSWQEVSVSVDLGAQPSLSLSALILSLEGTIFE